MKFILGKKLNMTQLFREDGTVVPVTRVQAGPCVVTQVKTEKKDGVNSVQIGFGSQKKFRLSKALQGHLKDLESLQSMREFRVDADQGLKRGDAFDLTIFEAGEKVQVTGRSKGRGFQGVVKRHNFKGAPASHGHKDQLRMPGSIGATDAARVFKGTRMGGHMGDDQITVTNLEVVEIHPESGELFIKGAIPGARGGLLLISTKEGNIEIKAAEAPAEEVKEEVKEETPAEASEEKKEETTPVAEEVKEETAPEAEKTEEKPE
jgi:large subunit ribosomal protein L3